LKKSTVWKIHIGRCKWGEGESVGNRGGLLVREREKEVMQIIWGLGATPKAPWGKLENATPGGWGEKEFKRFVILY